MTEKIKKTLRDKAWARWTALVLVASMMFFAYMFVDVMSPLQSLVQTELGWTPEAFGYYAGAEYILNVFGFLILAGIILDKMGVRFTGVLSASVMFVGACIKLYAISDYFVGSGLDAWLSSWWTDMPGSAKLAALGFMIFGCGCEMAGITVSKTLAKWFEGHEMALAMGLEMALARVGVFVIFTISPRLASWLGEPTVVTPVAFCTVLLLIGLISYTVFTFMDTRLDREIAADRAADAPEEEFKMSDVGNILSSKLFWIIAMLCVLYYSAIFPFQRYATNMLQCNLGMDEQQAADIFRWFPIGAAGLTPVLGFALDRWGKGATMLMGGAILMILCILHSRSSFRYIPSSGWPSLQSSFSAYRSRSFRPRCGLRCLRLWKRVISVRPIRSFSGCRTSASPSSPFLSAKLSCGPIPASTTRWSTTIPCLCFFLLRSVCSPSSSRYGSSSSMAASTMASRAPIL